MTAHSEIRSLPLSALVFSQTPMQVERRKMRTEAQISDRADSIRSVGVLQPILVRPLDTSVNAAGNWDKWEVAAGEGRVLSAREAGLAEIPAIVRELTNEQIEEIQLIENLQRDDVHGLVEALGYETLLKHGHSVDEIAQKVGKSKRTIYTRLQLLKLDPATHDAFRSGRLDFSKALLVASLPVAVDQRKAGGEISDMTYVRAKEHIEREYMLRLADAPFDTADATLLRNTPACSPCPKRTGNQPELFEVSKSSADICTDKRCFRAKCEAGAKLKLALARQDGQEILSGPDAKKVMPYEHMAYLAGGYTKPDEKCWDDPKGRTYGQILGKDHKPTLLQSPYDKGVVIEIVEKSAALKKLKDDGVIKPEKKTSPAKAASTTATPGKQAFAQRYHRKLFAEICTKVQRIERWTLELLALNELEHGDVPAEVLEQIGFGGSHAEHQRGLQKASDAKLQELLLALLAGFDFEGYGKPTKLIEIAKHYKVNADKVCSALVAADKAEAAAVKVAKKAMPAKASKKKATRR